MKLLFILTISILLLPLQSCKSNPSSKNEQETKQEETFSLYQIEQLINDSNTVILDVRTPEEYAEAHFKGAINLPIDTLESTYHSLEKSKNIITICRSGRKSKKAYELLKSKKYPNVYNGGGWKDFERKISETQELEQKLKD